MEMFTIENAFSIGKQKPLWKHYQSGILLVEKWKCWELTINYQSANKNHCEKIIKVEIGRLKNGNVQNWQLIINRQTKTIVKKVLKWKFAGQKMEKFKIKI